MKTLTNLALAPVRLTAAILTAAVTDRLDALTSQIENVKSDNEDTADVLSELIERVEDLETLNASMRTDDTGYLYARNRVRARNTAKQETVIA